MAYCRECGSPVPEGARFCVECGAPQPGAGAAPAVEATAEPAAEVSAAAAPAPTPMAAPAAAAPASVYKCRTCGAKVPEGEPACPVCGTPVPGAQAMAREQGASREPVRRPAGAATPRREGHSVRMGQAPPASTAPMPAAEPAASDGARASGMVGQTAAFASSRAGGRHTRGRHAAEPARRSRGALPVVAGLMAVALVAVVAVLVVPRLSGRSGDPGQGEGEVIAQPAEKVSTAEPTAEPSAEPAATPPEAAAAEPAAESPADAQPTAQTVPTAQDEPDPQAFGQPTEAEPVGAQSYVTSERPTIGEFTSWFSNDLMNGNAPAGIARITDFGAVVGGWKAYVYNYAMAGDEHSQSTEELLNVYVDAGQDQVVVSFDWYYTRLGDGSVYEDSTPDSQFYGSWSNGTLEAVGAGAIRLTDFWEQDGHQYAIGRITWPDGVDGTIGLVRP